MVRTLLAIALLFLAGYGLIEAWPLIQGPSLAIDSPADQASFEGGILTVSGKASRIAMLSLNGASVPHDVDGSFSTVLTFPRGGSILTFIATDRFGRRITATRAIYVPTN
jgi:uncharacterized protein YfaP (DUF2135 family)